MSNMDMKILINKNKKKLPNKKGKFINYNKNNASNTLFTKKLFRCSLK